jgi:hypothetical protein
MATTYQIFQATTDPYERGIAYANYQLEGLGARETDIVKKWRRDAMDHAKRVRSDAKRTQLNGFVRGCSDFLARVS